MTLTARERLLLSALDRMDVLLDVLDGEYPGARADEDDLRAVLPLLDEAALRSVLEALLEPIDPPDADEFKLHGEVIPDDAVPPPPPAPAPGDEFRLYGEVITEPEGAA
jgi:hypothetical protein